ncbi:OPT family oligopeptide transporter [Microcoleus sp. FACHB-672]|uniref:OPT family oligopeptide transporter n=1 Tax=Microcoleus sp. FACHB-672 TaxID=2692825 RepID=UPI001689E82A|nr:oligopeptide transporter, OPT family [Microcoleus sp. FACHB-672]MBD2040198.1 oligopeptide transporter, OPT family [Microcoleus sp. FACHB-672]
MSEDANRPEIRLPAQAYQPLPPGEEYQPAVPADVQMPELTIRSLIVGIATGILFGAANAYLALKVGLTVSASIPAAVIAVAIFRATGRGTLLETNMVQTIGSSGDSLAAGVIFTIPVLYLWGETPGFWPIFPLSILGGLLGILFMIPLRRLLIVREHGRLTYPEGTACAEVQVAAQGRGRQAQLLFTGMGIGAIYTALERFAHLWPAEVDIAINRLGFRTSVGADVTPELLGVGYIIGPQIAAVMLAGGAVGWLVIIPLIYLFGSAAGVPIAPELTTPIAQMDSFTIWSRYLRYIGAGAVAFGGLFTLIKSAPTLWESVRVALAGLRQRTGRTSVARTDEDLPFSLVLAGLIATGLLVAFLPLRTGGPLGIPAGIAVVVFSFFFVTVSSRIVGLIGSSSNPISGMTIATVLICALLFGQAYSPAEAKIAVLTIGALVCIAAAMAGDTSQDLKTGFLLGASPRNQQIGEIIAIVATALVMSTVMELFRADIVAGNFKAPQANLIKLVIEGVLGGNLPWGLVLTGIALAGCVEMMGLPTLAFAVGLYLPIHLAVPIMVGGLIRLFVERRKGGFSHQLERGVLYASGLIAGAALMGVVAAIITFFQLPLFQGTAPAPSQWLIAAIAFSLLSGSLWRVCKR